MKNITKLLTITTAGLLLIAPLTVSAQPAEGAGDSTEKPEAREGRGGPGGGFHKFRHMQMMRHAANKNLTEEEREILKAAHEEVREDEEVKAAREAARGDREKMGEVRELVREKLIATNPAMEQILDKMKEGVGEMRHHRGGRNPQREEMRERLSKLTPEERKALGDARKEVKDNPEVQAARENLKETVRTAILNVNPDLKTALDKIEPAEE